MPTPKTMPYIGRALKRVEDPRLIKGIATYVDDLALPGMLHAAILRSPYAHARINSVRTEAARARRTRRRICGMRSGLSADAWWTGVRCRRTAASSRNELERL